MYVNYYVSFDLFCFFFEKLKVGREKDGKITYTDSRMYEQIRRFWDSNLMQRWLKLRGPHG